MLNQWRHQYDTSSSENDLRHCQERCYNHNKILQWRHKEHDVVSNHRRIDCILSHLFRDRPKKALNIKALHHWVLWGEFTGDQWIPCTKRASNTEMFPFDNVITIHDKTVRMFMSSTDILRDNLTHSFMPFYYRPAALDDPIWAILIESVPPPPPPNLMLTPSAFRWHKLERHKNCLIMCDYTQRDNPS